MACPETECQQIVAEVPRNLLLLSKNKLTSKINFGQKYKDVSVEFSFPQKLTITLQTSNDYLVYNQAISSTMPELSMYDAPVSSESSTPFQKPSQDIANQTNTINFLSFKVLPGGHSEIVSTTSSKIISLTREKKDQSWYQDTYKLIKMVSSYYDLDGVYLIDKNLYFYKQNKPDLIVELGYNENRLISALQVLGFLTTIKQDPKIIDLRYTNPIIR